MRPMNLIACLQAGDPKIDYSTTTYDLSLQLDNRTILLMSSARKDPYEPGPDRFVHDTTRDIHQRLCLRRDFSLLDESTFADVPAIDPYDALPVFLAMLHHAHEPLASGRLVSFGRLTITGAMRQALSRIHEQHNQHGEPHVLVGNQRHWLKAACNSQEPAHTIAYSHNVVAPIYLSRICKA